MVELEQVTKWYGRRRAGAEALRDVSLHVPEGAVWAIVGPNGAGKSTLLALLLGFLRPSRGSVSVAGDLPRHYLRDHGAAYLPERFGLPPEWRTGDALRMFARLDGASAAEATLAIERFGLGPHVDKRVGALSRGLLQRLGLAQALLAPRSLVVLDEPTEGLDPVWRIRLRDAIQGLRGERTVIIASHDLAEVERVADRAVLLERGAVREILVTRSGEPDTRYRLQLAAPFEAVRDFFPDATADPAAPTAFTVSVANAVELSQRIAALLAQGAILAGVEPLRLPLEERVRDALEDDA
jgi:ABC-2 type transport system ATP-binding protein